MAPSLRAQTGFYNSAITNRNLDRLFSECPGSGKAIAKLVKLESLGWKIEHCYADLVVNLSKDFNGERVMVFVEPNGNIHDARTNGTMLAACELRENF